MPSECDRLGLYWEEHAEGAAPPEMREVLDRHLAACADCRKEFASAARVVRRLRDAFSDVELPAPAAQRIAEEVSRRAGRVKWRLRLFPRLRPVVTYCAAAAALLLVVSVFLRSPEPDGSVNAVFATAAGPGQPEGPITLELAVRAAPWVKPNARFELRRGRVRIAQGVLLEFIEGRNVWSATVRPEAGQRPQEGDQVWGVK